MRGPLEGIRVFDLTLIMVGPWTTMNLGALGADVIHIERPGILDSSLGGGVPPTINGTSVGHITWNMNKRQMFLDLKSAIDLDIAKQLLATCDVFVDNMRPGVADRLGLSYEALSELNPRIVYCTICGWGTTGPMADRTAADPQIQAFTGFSANSGARGGRPEVYRHFTQMDATTGNYATMAILMALLARERTGKGQRIDLTMLEAGTAVQATKVGEYLATGEQPPLMGSGTTSVVPSGAFETEDGTWLGVQATTAQQWAGLCAVLGLDDLASDARLATIAGRVEARDEIDARLAAALKTKPARWWQIRFGKASVPCARIMRFEELINHPQVTRNHYIEPVQTAAYGEVYAAGLPWTFSRTPASILPVAAAGEHTGEILDELGLTHGSPGGRTAMSSGPIEGYRVVELGQGVPAAVAGMHLGDGGADVVKVEPRGGDVARGMPPFWSSGESGVFSAINRNKRSIALDLASPQGRGVLRSLIAAADALVEDVDLTRELGLDVEALAAGNETLVHCRISGWGPEGPLSGLPGAEIAAQMASEAVLSLGSLTEPPIRLGTDAASTYAGIYAVQGILAALWRRHQDGLGQKVDVSLFGCMLEMRQTLWAALSNPDDWFGFHTDSYVKPADYGYQAKDGPMTLVVNRISEEQWASLIHDLGLDGLTDEEKHMLRTQGGVNARYGHLTKPIWERGLRNFTVDEAAAIFNRNGGNAYRINDYAHLVAHPQTRHLDITTEVPGAAGTLTVLKPPWHFSDDPVSVRLPPPSLGQHTVEVLRELGYDADAIEALRASGALS